MPIFQVITRDNKPGEKAFSLFIAYDINGTLAWMAEARSSDPDYRRELIGKGYVEIMALHLAPKTYDLVRNARKATIPFFLVK